MPQHVSGQYFSQSGTTAGLGITVYATSVRTATLTDSDLIRGDDAGESVAAPNGFRLFDGIQQIDFTQGRIVTVDDGEAATTVTFRDGTTLAGVRALYDVQVGPYGLQDQQFLLDPAALASVGKSLADIASVRVDGLIDHDLSWADFGFGPTEPAPGLVRLTGTAGHDRLTGTAAAERIDGGNGDDRLTGRGGADTFVFGADASDGNRDRDVITDFNAAEDTLLFEAGATIRLVEQRNGNLIIHLDGDRDTITVLNADIGIVAGFEFANDLLFG